ncbi:AaceriAFR617Cp [[Ashbya] aceris (nom. inval.)]|nr:AaceriAFR617Cp [[Ashbya] aceris (nom. inval.)]
MSSYIETCRLVEQHILFSPALVMSYETIEDPSQCFQNGIARFDNLIHRYLEKRRASGCWTLQDGYIVAEANKLIKTLATTKLHGDVINEPNSANHKKRKRNFRVTSPRAVYTSIWNVALRRLDGAVDKGKEEPTQSLDKVIEQFLINIKEVEWILSGLVLLYSSIDYWNPRMIPGYGKVATVEHFLVQYVLHRYEVLYVTSDESLLDKLVGATIGKLFHCMQLQDDHQKLVVNNSDTDATLKAVYDGFCLGRLPKLFYMFIKYNAELGDGRNFLQLFTTKYLQVHQEYTTPTDKLYIDKLKQTLRFTKMVFDGDNINHSDRICAVLLNSTVLNQEHLYPVLETCVTNEKAASIWLVFYSHLKNGSMKDCSQVFAAILQETKKQKCWVVLRKCLQVSTGLVYEKEMCTIFLESLHNRLGGDLQLIEFMAFNLDILVKRFMEYVKVLVESKSGFAKDFMESNFYEKTLNEMESILRVMKQMKLFTTFINFYYERYWFRRLVLYAREYKRCLDREISLIEEKIEVYAENASVVATAMVEAVKDIKKNSTSIIADAVDAVSIVLPRSSVPDLFLEHNIAVKTLPDDLRILAPSLERKSPTMPSSTVLEQQFSLHHLEIETPFLLKDNRNLILDVTMVQACILDMFNNQDSVTLQDVSAKYGIELVELKTAMDSFVSIHMVKSEGNQYIIDPAFDPNINVSASGKRRVPYTSSRHPKAAEKRDSAWRVEVIRAALVRTLKYEQKPLTFESLKSAVSVQIDGFSVGEFKAALDACKDYYKEEDSKYIFVL